MPTGSIWEIGGERGSLRQAIVVPLIFGGIFLVAGLLPQAFSRQFRMSDYLHGSGPMLALIATSVFFTFMLTMRQMKQRSAAGESPSPAFMRNYGILYGLAILCVVGGTYQNHLLAMDLDTRGITEQASVVRTFIESCSKHGCTTGVEYVYRPHNLNIVERGKANEGNVSRNDNTEYQYIQQTNTIPILYDPKHPDHSMTDWNKSVHRQASFDYLAVNVILLLLIIIVPTCPPTILAWAYMKDLDGIYRSSNNML